MNQHAARFEVLPAPQLRRTMTLTADYPRKAKVRMRNIHPEGGDLGVVSGLQIDVFLKAESLDDAGTAATVAAEEIVVELSVLSGSRCGGLQPRLVTHVDPREVIHPFRQYVPIGPELSRRRLDPSKIRFFRDGLSKYPLDSRQSIRRGMHAYREAMSAMSTTDALVEFLLLWVSVEAMNVPLGRRRGINAPRSLEGTQRFFEVRLPGGDELYRRAKDLRNHFAHGSRDLEGMIAKANALVVEMRVATREAIASAIDMHWEGDRRPLKNWPTFLVIETSLVAPRGARLGPKGDLPHVRFGPQRIQKLMRSGNQVAFKTSIPTAQRFAPGVKWGRSGKAYLVGEQVELKRVNVT